MERLGKQLRLMSFEKRIVVDGYYAIALVIGVFALGVMCGLIIAGVIYGRTI